MTRSDPRSDFLSGKPLLPRLPLPSPCLDPTLDPPGVSRRTRTNVTRSNVTLIRFQCKTYDPPIMVRSHLPGIPRLSATQIAYARHAARIIDIDWCRRAALIALQTLPDRWWGRGIIAATLISSHVASVTRLHSTPRHFCVESGEEHKIIKITTLEAWITGFERDYYWKYLVSPLELSNCVDYKENLLATNFFFVKIECPVACLDT